MKNIKADIDRHSFKRVYLLYGDESYLLRHCLEGLRNAIVGDDNVNCTVFDGNTGYDVNSLKDLAVTLPFFADYRLIIVEKSGLFSGDSDFDEFLPNIPETTVLIIVEKSADKRTRLYKAIKNTGYAAEFTVPKPEQLMEFAAGYLGRDGKRILRSDCEYLIGNISQDMFNITTELDKLISYIGSRDSVTRADINAICSLQIENKIFDIVDSLMAHDKGHAMSIYYDLLALKEAPLGLLRFIEKQYNRLFMIKDEIEHGSSDSEIAGTVKLPDWVVRKHRTQLKNCSLAKLKRAIYLCTDTEEQIKTGNINEQNGLEILLANLSVL